MAPFHIQDASPYFTVFAFVGVVACYAAAYVRFFMSIDEAPDYLTGIL
jgi:hypothetical protein